MYGSAGGKSYSIYPDTRYHGKMEKEKKERHIELSNTYISD